MQSPTPLPDFVPPDVSSPEPRRAANRLPLLLLVLVAILVLAFIPALMERIEYRRTLGEVRALRETLPELNLKSLGKAFNLVYRKVKPSVVHIDTRRAIRAGQGDFIAMFNGRDRLYEAQGQASGVIVDQGGYIITNYHVIEDAETVTVQLDDGRSFEADAVGTDPAIDLAVLKINADGLTAATWGDSDKLEVGEMVWAIGNPFGLDQTITAGIVSAKGRRGFGLNVYQEFLQTDVAINPGNSGGPLVDINGEVVGINTAIVGRTFQGISFAIPANRARDVYEQIRKTGRVVRGYWGVRLDMPRRREAERLGLPLDRALGPIVREVTPGSPAEEAGVLPNDIVVEWNGQPVTDDRLLKIMIAQTPVGAKVPVKILREGKEVDLETAVAEQPKQGVR